MCDDITAVVEGGRVTQVTNACELGKAWFQQPRPLPAAVCTIRGKPANVEDGISAAIEILTTAKYPLIYGFGETTCEAQQAAVKIADWVGGTIDTATSFGHAPSIMAFQNVGKVTCSLGEIGNRSNLIIYWGANPAENQPRLLSKYTIDKEGLFVPKGRAGRHVVVVDVRETETTRRADQAIILKPGSDFDALWALRALAKGITPDAAAVEAATGVPLSVWAELMERMKVAQYGALLFGMGLMRTRGQYNNCEAMLRLAGEMNAYTRWICRSVRQRGNVTGADKVVAWSTGYPFCVNLSRGYPRYTPGEFNTSRQLARGEADAAMVVGNDPMPDFTTEARQRLREIPTIVFSSVESKLLDEATVGFRTAMFGLETGGTVYRMDEIPLALRPVLKTSLPTDAAILQTMERTIREARVRAGSNS